LVRVIVPQAVESCDGGDAGERPFTRHFDSLVDMTATPLLPNEERTVLGGPFSNAWTDERAELSYFL
jgi:hypothetical protein